jgi:uncharacterized protein YjbJ (UPF0337 family)
MNKDQIKGAARQAAGKIQKTVGKATSNGTQTVKGAVREAAGKTQKAYGNAKADVKTAAKSRTKVGARTTRDRDIERHAR